MSKEPPEPPRKASAWQAVKAVFWAFLGIRKDKDYQLDAVTLSPVQVIITGIVAAVIFVIVLIVLVRHITA